MRSWVVFKGPVRAALHKLKYRRDIGLGEALAWPLAEYVERELDWEIELLIPIPLSPQRLSERGYNQVGLIARPLAMINGWGYSTKAIQRTKHTRSQVGLSRSERQENVRNAFSADPKILVGRSILVMDDIATTGATLGAACRCVLEAGARQVYALTAARAIPRYDLDRY